MATPIRCLAACALVSLALPALNAQDGPVLEAPTLAGRQARGGTDEFIVPPPPAERDDAPVDSRDTQPPPGQRGGLPRDTHVPTPPAPAADDPPAPARGDRSAPDPSAGDRSYENYLGVTMDRVPDALAAQFADVLEPGQGLLVRSVAAGSAADQAGLRANDVLVAYEGEPLWSPDDLKRLVVNDERAATVELTIIRGARAQTVTVTLGQRAVAPPPVPVPADFGAAPVPGPPPIDIHVPGRRSIVVDRYGFRSPWVAVEWGSPLAGRRFQALTPGGRQFGVDVRVYAAPRRPYRD